MANRFFGEAVTEVDGTRYTLRCDFNAMVAFEDMSGKDALDTFQALETGKVKIRDMRHIMQSMLQHHHPDVTPELAGYILSKDIDVLTSTIQAASPSSEEAEALGNGVAPKVAKVG